MSGQVMIGRSSELTGSKTYGYDKQYGAIMLSALVYNNLKSPMICLSVTYETEPSGAYLEFMRDMDNLNLIYNGVEQDVISADEENDLRKVDDYISELGIDETYPIAKEILYLQKFINIDYVSPVPDNLKD